MKDDLTCPQCQMGRLELHLVTYIELVDETLISVPSTPAWICDVCRAREFDPAVVERIEMLIGQTGGPPPNHYKPVEPVRKVTRPPLKRAAKMRPKANKD